MNSRRLFTQIVVFCFCVLIGCKNANSEASRSVDPNVPRGYQKRLEIQIDDRVLYFGPFVGYYFKPIQVPDFSRLDFLCFNEGSFYTKDLEPNTLLYRGTAVLQLLDDRAQPIPETGQRIVPVFFPDAPDQWIQSRPEPKQGFVHFHSAYNSEGAVHAGFWLSHEAVESFTYDMGGRVGPDSPLHHEVQRGLDVNFARIIEFDHGP